MKSFKLKSAWLTKDELPVSCTCIVCVPLLILVHCVFSMGILPMVCSYISHSAQYDGSINPLTWVMAHRVQPLVRGLYIRPNKDSRARVKWICGQGRIPAAEQTRAQSCFSAPRSTRLLKGNVSVKTCHFDNYWVTCNLWTFKNTPLEEDQISFKFILTAR